MPAPVAKMAKPKKKSNQGKKKNVSPVERIKARVLESRRTQKLNLSCLDLMELPKTLHSQIKAAGVTNILDMDFHNNNLSTLPKELGDMKALKSLRIDHNCFHSLPHVLYHFAKLEALDASKNEFEEIDDELLYLVTLKDLDFSHNRLTTLPDFWENFPCLTNLTIVNNALTALPESFGALKNLERLDLSRNQLTDLPKSFGHCDHLIFLDIRDNCFTVLPTLLCLIKTLAVLECGENPLTEPVNSYRMQTIDRLKEYLKDLREQQRLEELARNKPVGFPAGPYMSYETKSEFHHGPVTRTGHSVTQVGTVTYIFGGMVNNFGQTDDLYAIDAQTLVWTKPVTTGTAPAPRDGHAAAFDGYRGLYIFGGRNEEHKLLNDVTILDLHDWVWSKPPVEGSLPCTREGAAMVICGSQLVVFGGRGDHQRYNDIFTLDIRTWVWSPNLTKGSERPIPRKNAAIYLYGDRLYVHGGRTSIVLDDLYYFNIPLLTWTKISQKGRTQPSARYGHTAYIRQNRFYIVGGFDEHNQPLISMHCFFLERDDGDKVDEKSIVSSIATSSMNETCSSISEGTNPLASKSDYFERVDEEIEQIATDVAVDQAEIELRKLQLRIPVYHTWVEFDCDLMGRNKPRIYAFHSDKLLILQEPEVEPELDKSSNCPFWENYLEAEIKDFEAKWPQEKRKDIMRTKKLRMEQLGEAQMEQFPRSYRITTKRESLVLEHAKHFRKRFMQLYQTRLPLCIYAKNECGVKKFLCSTIRPSQLEYTELFHWTGCSQFVATFLTYESLSIPTRYPSCFPSPATVIKWQRGDSFDFAITLVSLLAGVGYNAYCVAGYAPIFITKKRQDKFEFKHVPPPRMRPPTPPKPVVPPPAKAKYFLKNVPTLDATYLGNQKKDRDKHVSSYVGNFKNNFNEDMPDGLSEEQDMLIRFMAERFHPESYVPMVNKEEVNKEEGHKDTTDSSSEKKGEEVEDPEVTDLLLRRRLHCWVMIGPGKREIAEHFLIEPSTGSTYTFLNSPYYGVEMVWNESNLWVNMQYNVQWKKFAPLDQMCWDLRDTTKWNAVLNDVNYDENDIENFRSIVEGSDEAALGPGMPITVTGASPALPKTPPGAGEKGTVTKESKQGAAESSKLQAGAGDQPQKPADPPPSPPPPASSAPGSTPVPAVPSGNNQAKQGAPPAKVATRPSSTPPIKMDKTKGFFEPDETVNPKVQRDARFSKERLKADMELSHWLLPPSWIPKLEIEVEAVVTRCRLGAKKTKYNKCSHEMFAFYGDYVRWDGLDERLLYYANKDHSVITECHDYFRRRKDRLYKRVTYFADNKVHEFFEPGTVMGIKEIVTVEGLSRKFTYYSKARIDGLQTRDEIIGHSIDELYDKPGSRMFHRQVRYGHQLPAEDETGVSPSMDAFLQDKKVAEVSKTSLKDDRSRSSQARSNDRLSTSQRAKQHLAQRKSSNRLRSFSGRGGKKKSKKSVQPEKPPVPSWSTTRKKYAIEKLLPISKITQKFKNEHKEDPQQNVNKEVYWISTDQMRIDFHDEDGRITSVSRLYSKDGTLHEDQAGVFDKKLEPFPVMDEFHNLIIAERAVIQGVRESERDIRELLQQRAREELNIYLVTPYPDVARYLPEDIQEAEVKREKNYLTPFWPAGVRPRQKLTLQQQWNVREACLGALKDRLVNRAAIIQRRLDEEIAALAKRKMNFERDKEAMTVADEEMYEKACERSAFAIRILQERQIDHEKRSLEKYTELDARLKNDPRLPGLKASILDLQAEALAKAESDSMMSGGTLATSLRASRASRRSRALSRAARASRGSSRASVSRSRTPVAEKQMGSSV